MRRVNSTDLVPMPDLSRRTFLKGAAAASAVLAFTPTGAAADVTQGSPTWQRVPCRMCGVGCGLLVAIQNGRAVAAKGDPESPVSGGLACVKGYYAIQSLYGRDRLTRALVRRDDALVASPMGESLDLVAERLRQTIERHGPDSVAIYGSGQWTAADALVAARLFRGAIGTRSVDTSARLLTASADTAFRDVFGLPGPAGGYEDIDEADTFILWNANLAETDPVLFSRILERRRSTPSVRIVEVAARTTRTSYAADRSLLYAPGSELAIANAICQELVARKMAHRDFVDRYVTFKRGAEGIGSSISDDQLVTDDGTDADWNAMVRFLDDYTPERAQEISGIAAADVRWLATLYGDPMRKVVTAWGSAINGHGRGTWVNNALHNLHLLTGKVATPGNAALPVTGSSGGAALLADALGTTGRAPDASVRERVAAARGVSADRLDDRPGRPALSIFRGIERGEIRFLWIQAANPLVSLPNLGAVRNALRSRQCFLVVSDVYPTPTTDEADVVLPAAMWFERDGEYVNTGRRVQHFDRLVRPPGDAMSDAQQMMAVARRLGHGSLFPWEGAEAGSEMWEAVRQLHDGPSSVLPSHAALRAGSGLRWPAPDDAETSWRYNTRLDPAADASQGDFDFYGHADRRAWFWLRPYEPPVEPPDRQFPLWFSSGRVVEHWGTGSLTQRIPTLHGAVPHAYLEMHREDARPLGIRNGDRVRVTSRRGAVELEARIDYRGQPSRGQVFAPSFDEGARVNEVTLDAGCPLSGQPGGSCAVRVERVRGPA